MIRRSAERLTELCCERNWIEAEYREWCAYALEKWLGMLLFFAAVAAWMAASGRWVETLSFLLPFYLLRRRIGGCHAKTARACFCISMGLVVFASAFLGRWLLALPLWLLAGLDGAVLLLLLALHPAYPPQVNFTEEEKQANGRKKDLLLGEILLLQALSVVFLDGQILAHSLCGLAFAAVTVLIQKKIIKGDLENEQA